MAGMVYGSKKPFTCAVVKHEISYNNPNVQLCLLFYRGALSLEFHNVDRLLILYVPNYIESRKERASIMIKI